MNNRLYKKGLLRELRSLKKKRKENEKKKKEVNIKLHNLQNLISSCEMFGVDKVLGDKEDMNVDDYMTSKVWIASGESESDLVVIDFFDLIRNKEKPKKIVFTKLFKNTEKKTIINSYGEEVNLEPGALLFINKLKVEEGFGFHIANLGPADEQGKLQYKLALHKLGLGMKPYVDSILLETDGQFRALLTGEKKGEN